MSCTQVHYIYKISEGAAVVSWLFYLQVLVYLNNKIYSAT